MAKGSLKYLKSLKAQIDSDISEMEALISSIKNLLPQYSEKQRNHILKIIQDYTELDLSWLRTRENQMKKTLENQIEMRRKILALLNEYPFLKEKYSSVSDKDIVDFDETILHDIELHKEEIAKKEELKKQEDYLNSLETITSKLPNIDTFNSIEDAISSYTDNACDLFKCGQGFYEDEVETFCYVRNSFFHVKIEGEIGSKKMDVGDRVYWVESIKSVKLTPSKHEEYEKMNQAHLDSEISELEEKLNDLKAKKEKKS